MNRFPFITLLISFLAGCELQQESKPYEFKDEEQSAEKEIENPPRNPPPVTNRPASAQPSLQSGQDPNKPFAQDEDKVVRGTPRHAFPSIRFPE